MKVRPSVGGCKSNVVVFTIRHLMQKTQTLRGRGTRGKLIQGVANNAFLEAAVAFMMAVRYMCLYET